MGFFGLLFLVFLVLKLTGVILWSWWLVFSPLIAIPVIFIICMLFVLWQGEQKKKGQKALKWRIVQDEA